MLSIIAAVSRNGVIGKGESLPWHMPADTAYLKKTIRGHGRYYGPKEL
ncbi:MAG: dihydrofolate reductase [Bacteroidia bacterium]|nr:dihydrofolate reductase [Bacteroidia bacterium]